MSKTEIDTSSAFSVSADATYFTNEAWFEVSRGNESMFIEGSELSRTRPYIDVINSYGRLRRLYTDTGKYRDISNGGSEWANKAHVQYAKLTVLF